MRPDGILVKNEDPMYYLIPYFLTKRYDAMNMITLDIPEMPMRAYMNEKRKEGKQISHLALVLTAYLHTLEKYPALNRFIKGHNIYQHKDIKVSMVVLKPDGSDTMSKIDLVPTDDVFDVQAKITGYIDQNRQVGEANSFDTAMKILTTKLRWLLPPIIGLIRFLDNHGLLPQSLIDLTPFHASLLISNLASIRTNHIYHHVYEFGTTSIAITMGNMREVPRRTKDGIVFDRCMPLGVVMDERIASGHYMAQAFAQIKKYLADPSLMERESLDAEKAAEQSAEAAEKAE